jgi:hypothetical protein
MLCCPVMMHPAGERFSRCLHFTGISQGHLLKVLNKPGERPAWIEIYPGSRNNDV